METDIAVVGAGQAGLAVGYFLARQRRAFTLLDAAPTLGDAWRQRWDSLRLFTPAGCSGLPGLPFPGSWAEHPGRDAVADYLTRYAAAFELPVRLGTRVETLSVEPAGFRLGTGTGDLHARRVVLAVGPHQRAYRPAVADRLAAEVTSLHSAGYRSPALLPDGPVLVVGAGNSGAQIAAELVAAGREVTLAGRELPYLPQRPLGVDLFFWFDRLGMLEIGADTPRGHKLRAREAVIGTNLRRLARAGRLRRVPPVVDAHDDRVVLADGQQHPVSTVIWATGFRSHLPWLPAAARDDDAALIHTGLTTPVPGLYALGQPWQTHRSSALLAGVGRDAAVLAQLLQHEPAPAGHQ